MTREAGKRFGTFLATASLDPVKAVWEEDTAVPDVADFSVMRVYADVSGTRLVRDLRKRRQAGLFSAFSESALRELAAIITGVPEIAGRSVEELDTEGLPPRLGYHVIQSWKDRVAGRHPVYAGIGVDIPGNAGTRRKADPAYTAAVVREALRGSADGLVLCREYEEINAATMRVVRDAFQASRPGPG